MNTADKQIVVEVAEAIDKRGKSSDLGIRLDSLGADFQYSVPYSALGL